MTAPRTSSSISVIAPCTPGVRCRHCLQRKSVNRRSLFLSLSLFPIFLPSLSPCLSISLSLSALPLPHSLCLSCTRSLSPCMACHLLYLSPSLSLSLALSLSLSLSPSSSCSLYLLPLTLSPSLSPALSCFCSVFMFHLIALLVSFNPHLSSTESHLHTHKHTVTHILFLWFCFKLISGGRICCSTCRTV